MCLLVVYYKNTCVVGSFCLSDVCDSTFSNSKLLIWFHFNTFEAQNESNYTMLQKTFAKSPVTEFKFKCMLQKSLISNRAPLFGISQKTTRVYIKLPDKSDSSTGITDRQTITASQHFYVKVSLRQIMAIRGLTSF